MNSNLAIKQIQNLDIKQHSTIVVTSKRATGKSVLVQNLCYKLIQDYEYHSMIMFSSTAHLEEEWSFMNVIFNDDELDDKLQKLFDYQEKNIKKKQAVLIVLDDVNVLNNTRSKLLTKVYSLGRHLFLTIIVSVQYPKYILNGLIRNNIDYLFFSELNQTTLKGVYEMIFIDMTFKEKRQKQKIRDSQS
ncbi:hypothetical protein ABPG74_003057 [Tetrahymena malaccensis]